MRAVTGKDLLFGNGFLSGCLWGRSFPFSQNFFPIHTPSLVGLSHWGTERAKFEPWLCSLGAVRLPPTKLTFVSLKGFHGERAMPMGAAPEGRSCRGRGGGRYHNLEVPDTTPDTRGRSKALCHRILIPA